LKLQQPAKQKIGGTVQTLCIDGTLLNAYHRNADHFEQSHPTGDTKVTAITQKGIPQGNSL
jgi:hypothetical protein